MVRRDCTTGPARRETSACAASTDSTREATILRSRCTNSDWLGGSIVERSAETFLETDAWDAAVKVPALLAEAVLVVLLFLVVRRAVDARAARRVTLFYWLNPAVILATSVFGDTDALFVLPAVGALIAGVAGWPALAGGLIAAAVLTKPQAVFVAPAVALAIWNMGRSDRTTRTRSALAGAAVTSLVILTPIVVAGAMMNMTLALGTLTLGKDMLSNTGNLWWILGHILHVMQAPGMDVRTAIAIPAEIVPISAFTDFAPSTARIFVRLLGSALPLAAIAWGGSGRRDGYATCGSWPRQARFSCTPMCCLPVKFTKITCSQPCRCWRSLPLAGRGSSLSLSSSARFSL